MSLQFLQPLFIQTVHCGPSIGNDIDVSSSARGNRQSNKLKTYCLYSSQSGLVPVFTPGETGLDKSTLIDDCSKNGSTHQYSKGWINTVTYINSILPVIFFVLLSQCHAGSSVSETLVPALTASHFLLSSCTLIIGLLVGSLSHRCCRKKTNMSSMNEKVAEEPVYSEIPPKSVPSANHVCELVKSVDNVAYGQVSPLWSASLKSKDVLKWVKPLSWSNFNLMVNNLSNTHTVIIIIIIAATYMY